MAWIKANLPAYYKEILEATKDPEKLPERVAPKKPKKSYSKTRNNPRYH